MRSSILIPVLIIVNAFQAAPGATGQTAPGQAPLRQRLSKSSKTSSAQLTIYPTVWDNRIGEGLSIEFVETAKFSDTRDAYFGGDEGFRLFQSALMENPRRGDVIPGAGGIRKCAGRTCGVKRAAWRPADHLSIRGRGRNILLLVAYDKEVAVDLTPDQKRQWSAVAQAYKNEMRSTRR